MLELSFRPRGIRAVPTSASPQLGLQIEIHASPATWKIHGALLRSQVRIEADRRDYSDAEALRLKELFGERHEWTRSLTSLMWAEQAVSVGAFSASTEVEIPVACSFDFMLASSKYLDAVRDGILPISVALSGSVFYASADAPMQVAPIPWSHRVELSLPAALHREVMDRFYPDSTVVPLGRDVFDRLYRYRVQQGLGSWDQALERLLAEGGR